MDSVETCGLADEKENPTVVAMVRDTYESQEAVLRD